MYRHCIVGLELSSFLRLPAASFLFSSYTPCLRFILPSILLSIELNFSSLSLRYIGCHLALTVIVFLDCYRCCVVTSQSICLSDQEGCVTW